MTRDEPRLDQNVRAAIWAAYKLLITLADEKTADGDGLDSEPQSAADDAPTARPGVQQGV